ncbi:glucan endo-1,3-beta-glucosidase 3-like [Aristolochia californica]|uniref:glucan endo-1,3-beta-glucosidase 3-like n=1 Tax=Aristolochia californica TaxID=171875 RepID=UPI0035E214EC
MATKAAKILFFFTIALFIIYCSGTHVGFSYYARKNRGSSSLAETISFLRKNQVPSSQMKISTAGRSVLLSLANTGIEVHLYVNETTVNLSALKDETSAITWLNTNLVTYLPRINITTIVFNIGKSVPGCPPSLLSALTSIDSALKTLNLDNRISISISVSLSNLENSDKKQKKYLQSAIYCTKKWGSFVSVETEIKGQLSLGDHFVGLVMEKVISAATLLPLRDVPLVLNVRSSVYPSAEEFAGFSKKMKNALTVDRISRLFVEISPMEEFELNELNREKEQIFPSLRRQLVQSSKTFVHEIINPPTTFVPATPLTNPVTTPGTVPTGPFVSVPSNSPVTVLPTNPVTTPITIPPTVLVPPPAAIPVTNPATSPPVTNPVTAPPVTNPVTTPVTVPETPPMTNPVTTYPFPPPGGTPVETPVTTPVTFPGPPPGTTLSPVVSGQSWCVAKMGAMDTALQMALDYACGIGGADCSAIQQGGPCYTPNSFHDHASYAFNNYYQKNPTPTSCDFGGAAMLTNINPSSGSCVYPSSSGSSGSPSSVLNTNNFTTTTSIFGSTPPGVTTSNSASSSLSSMLVIALGSLVSLLMNEQHFTCSIF